MPEIVAYHEAGHALMALLLGGKVKHATIEPDDDDELLRLCFGWVVPFNLAHAAWENLFGLEFQDVAISAGYSIERRMESHSEANLALSFRGQD